MSHKSYYPSNLVFSLKGTQIVQVEKEESSKWIYDPSDTTIGLEKSNYVIDVGVRRISLKLLYL